MHLLLELLVGTVRRALQPELEAAGGAQARDRRRVDGDDRAVLVGGELLLGLEDQVLGALAVAALIEALERDEQRACIGLVLGIDQAVAVHRCHRGHAGLPGQPCFRARRQVAGAVQAGGIRHHHGPEQVALVLHRQERPRNAREHQHADGDHREDDRNRHHGTLDDDLQRPVIAGHQPVKRIVEPGEETVLLVFAGLEQDGCQRGRQRQRDHARKHHRHRDRDGKLLVELAGNARQECHRDEHGQQHQHDGDHRAADFVHGLLGSLLGRQLELDHVALDVLDHHDGIVHDDADR